ncbi:alpha/beta fold hydrolase [Marinobacter alexandrii]|uniref:alpha/beta fold hydrolase n=1 Tax=Marinobacter alexandrii TaxID=2570351 RepID=UPI0011088FB8|nr:alpha/beta hydrolase [Marinobacter alexandrii]
MNWHQVEFQGYVVDVLIEEPAPENANGQTVILLHGFPDSPLTWKDIIKPLAEVGYTVKAPHMPGYQSSYLLKHDDYRLESLGREAVALCQALSDGPVHLVGHDWGAAVAYMAVYTRPETFTSFTAVSIPPIFRMIKLIPKRPLIFRHTWYQVVFQLRFVADWLMKTNGWWFHRYLWKRWSNGHSFPDLISRSQERMEEPGVLRATLRYYQQAYRPWDRSWFRLLNTDRPFPVPTLIVAGDKDAIYGPDTHRHAIVEEDFPKGVTFELLPGVGHFVQAEAPRYLLPPLLNHIGLCR